MTTPKGAIRQGRSGQVYAGPHLFVDLWDADHGGDVEVVRAAVDDAVAACGAHQLDAKYLKYSEEGGVTGYALLAESHICINTWTEHRMIAIDVFVCGQIDPYAAVPVFVTAFNPGRTDICEHKRMLATPSSHPALKPGSPVEATEPRPETAGSATPGAERA